MTFRLRITTGSDVPIYRQIGEQIRLGVGSGTLAAGERLSSVRATAQRLLVNPNTVARAYGDLVREGVLRSEQGRGLFVDSKPTTFTKAERHRRLQPLLENFVNEALALGFSAVEIRASLEKKMRQAGTNESTSGGHPHG